MAGMIGAIVVLAWVAFWQYLTIEDMKYDINKLRIDYTFMEGSQKDELDRVKNAVLELNYRLEWFVEVHDENVDVMEEMREAINSIINYLS